MAPVTNGSAIFNKIPEGLPDAETITYKAGSIDLDNVPLNGGFLVKTHYFSIDAHFRIFMAAPSPALPTAYKLGESVWGSGIASVLRSEKEGIQKGDIIRVADALPFQEYSVLPASQQVTVIKPEPGVSLSAHLSVLGMPGKCRTAFYGLEMIGEPKAGECIYISTGAGAVGSVVAQLAKAKGLKVIASAGSDDKVQFMKQIGVDVPFNYKTEKVADVLAREGPVDIYWDNVGGPTLDAVLEACNQNARIIVCGSISAMNGTDSTAIKNISQILFKQIRMQGFLNWIAEEAVEGQIGNPVKFLSTVPPLVSSGKLKYAEQVFEGIERIGEATVAVHNGTSTAKVVVKITDLYFYGFELSN